MSTKTPPREKNPSTDQIRQRAARIRAGWPQDVRVNRRRAANMLQELLLSACTRSAA